MPSGVGFELLVVAGLFALLLTAFLIGRSRRREATAPRSLGTRWRGIGGRIRGIFGPGEPTGEDWARLEQELIRADAGPGAAGEIVTRVRERYRDGDDPASLIAEEITGLFDGDRTLDLPAGLAVVMVVGVNGTGKTTTIGKLARWLAGAGRSVALAASDTFRAGAAEQLEAWAERAGADMVSQSRGADPGAVAHDAVQAARARGHDVLIVDTAGRLHTRRPLMDELAKVKRVLDKAAGRVDEVLLVVDATTGQNGIAQAREFLDSVGVTGIVLTKLDGTAKGGVVLAIREELGVPVLLVGSGEGIDDLHPFDAGEFARSLVGDAG